MIGHAACVTYAVPFRCTFITMSQSSSGIFLKLLSRRMPALLTRMCTVPNALTASSMIDLAPSLDETDALFAIAVPPAALISFTTRSAASPEPVPSPLPPRSLTTTFAPRFANSSACALPSPPPAPVITTTLSLKSLIESALLPGALYEYEPPILRHGGDSRQAAERIDRYIRRADSSRE